MIIESGGSVFASTGGRAFDASAEVLVFIHGSGQNHLGFHLQARFLANRGFSVLVPDRPGHFKTEGIALGSIEDMARWYSAVLDASGAARAHIIGHSQGGLIALEWARLFPAQVRSIAIIASALAIPVNADLLALARDDEPRAIAAMVDWGHGTRGHSHSHTVPGMAHLNYGEAMMGMNAAGTLFADLSACQGYSDGAAAADAIAGQGQGAGQGEGQGESGIPALCILAGSDKMTPIAQGRKLAEALSAQVVEIAGAGHMLPNEHPDEVNLALRKFWQGLD